MASDFDNQGIILLEAIACGKPVMGPDLPSLRSYFGDTIFYAPSARSSHFPRYLENFWNQVSSAPMPSVEVLSWQEVGTKVKAVYDNLMAE